MKNQFKGRYFISGFIFMGLLAGLTGCVSQNSTADDEVINTTVRPEVDDSTATPQGIKEVVEANNKFTLSMFKDIHERPEQGAKNIFFSPYSISTAVAMLYTATEGETKQQIKNTFYYPQQDVLQSNMAALHNQSNKENDNYALTIVNDLWLEQSYTPKKAYVETVKRYYGGQVNSMDFRQQPQASREYINTAIANYTKQMIKDLLQPKDVRSDTVAVLTNAIYFKGDWHQPFKPENTASVPFYGFDSGTSNVDMMYQTLYIAYTEDAQAQVITLPYKGDDLSMTVVLPKTKTKSGMDRLINDLNMTMLDHWNNAKQLEEVVLSLPKFKLEENYELSARLSDMGMPRVFQGNAGIVIFEDSPPLAVDAVIHKAVVEVDETGTEAAAATAIIAKPTYAAPNPEPPKVFTADHPFIFMIKDDRTDTILFMGQVNQPEAT